MLSVTFPLVFHFRSRFVKEKFPIQSGIFIVKVFSFVFYFFIFVGALIDPNWPYTYTVCIYSNDNDNSLDVLDRGLRKRYVIIDVYVSRVNKIWKVNLKKYFFFF